jgi:hypothetical protein
MTPNGRENRRTRRETARALAKEIMRDGGNRDKERKRGRIFTYAGISVSLASWGYFALVQDPNVISGCGLIFLAACCWAMGFWDFVEWAHPKKLVTVLCALLLVGIGDYYWGSFLNRPSFAYMWPGAWINNNTWDFIIGHKGPKTSRSVEILFMDLDKQNEVLKGRTSISRQDIDTYQKILNYPEVNPKGRGHVFATQFLWTPLVPNHEHYAMQITASDITVREEVQIERVSDNWLFAMEVRDWESKKVLLSCRDPGFPYGQPAKSKCVPDVTLSGD